jgi:hypothetical protein
MSDFISELRQRVAEAQRELAEAQLSGDDYQVQVSLGQIESFAQLAAANHVPLDGVEESLAAHGLSSPPYARVLDLTPGRLNSSPS